MCMHLTITKNNIELDEPDTMMQMFMQLEDSDVW